MGTEIREEKLGAQVPGTWWELNQCICTGGETNLVFRPRKPKAIRTLQVAAGNVRCEMRSED